MLNAPAHSRGTTSGIDICDGGFALVVDGKRARLSRKAFVHFLLLRRAPRQFAKDAAVGQTQSRAVKLLAEPGQCLFHCVTYHAVLRGQLYHNLFVAHDDT